MSKRSKVPKYIKREKPEPVSDEAKKKYLNPMKFKHRDAKKPRPPQNKGRHEQGGYWGKS